MTLACSASPASVFPGEPVTVTATAGALDPKVNAIYTWTGTGVTGNGTTATVATGSLAAGTYTVKGDVKEGKAGKEGLKPGESADCSASFTVKAYEPPTISCSANPSTIKPGETQHHYLNGHEPAEPSADLQLHGICRHRHAAAGTEAALLFGWRAHGRSRDHLQRIGRQGPDGHGEHQRDDHCTLCRAGAAHPGAVLDHLHQGQEASDARG